MHIATALAALGMCWYNGRMFRHHLLSRPLLALSLAAVLLFAQWLLVQHEAQFEPHTAGHSCEWCLTHAPLAAATLSAAQPLPSAGGVPVRPVAVLLAPLGAPALAYSSRAPPVFLSA